jgi:hypothetical protein
MNALRIATFRVNVTPPPGSPLCAGLVAPVRAVADPLFAIGMVLLGDEAPIVLCAVDWCEVDNEAHLFWQSELARAAGTTADRVALHTVHQHNAPIVDLAAEELVSAAADLPHMMDVAHFRSCVAATAAAARGAMTRARRVDGVAIGTAVVKEVASARRILGEDGTVRLTRWSSSKEPELQQAPEGLIDPVLRTATFLDAGIPLVSLHFYATHPMSYYGDGIVTADFAGLARERRCAETPGCEHLYFNGCGGDITAGKYNEGTPESRIRLTDRIHAALVQSESAAQLQPLTAVSWRSLPMTLPPRRDLVPDVLLSAIKDRERTAGERLTAALRLTYLQRLARPSTASCLGLGADAGIVFLPGEAFIEYQLFAARQRPTDFTAVAAYGDTGAGYIPLARSFAEGGYEIGASSVSEDSEEIMKRTIRTLLSS